jgi:Fe2+ or Zn2+ uptake regulation protein
LEKTKRKRNTRQKAVVYQIVKSSHDHPTAEKIYERAKKEIPKISLGTVYRILKELAEEGKIREIVIGRVFKNSLIFTKLFNMF